MRLDRGPVRIKLTTDATLSFVPPRRIYVMRTCLLTLVAVLSPLSGPLSGADYWNQFRGARGDGQSTAKSLPLQWSETQHVAWKTAIRGKAWSSPVVWGDQVWMTSATEDGKQLFAICVDARTGKIVHDLTVFEIAKPMFCIPYNSYASPTPIVEEGRVWVHFGSAGTACLDTATGKTLWARQDLPCDHFRGPGSSPIPFRDFLIVNFDGFDFQYVVALDKRTGQTVWKTDRTIDYGSDDGDFKKAYCTPTVFEHHGRLQVVSPAAVGTVAYDPLTGQELWKVYHGGFNAAARPLYSHGLVIISTEGGLRLLAVRPDGTGDVTKTHIAWKCGKATPTRPSQLIVQDHLYMVNDQGIVSCLDIQTGEATWTQRMGGRHSASPIHAAGRIYFFDEDGTSRVIEAQPREFRLLAENPLDAGCMATPAVLGEALIIRTKTHLYRIEG
jgi:outer membrane protein assembly factor BamB